MTVTALPKVSGAVHVVALLLVPVDRIWDNTGQGSHALVGRNLERARAGGIGAGPGVPNAVAQQAGVCAVRSAGLTVVCAARPGILAVASSCRIRVSGAGRTVVGHAVRVRGLAGVCVGGLRAYRGVGV